ncbi:Flp pilus assembly protein CpaB [Novosphingobium cyanobacteriorum]|uniref:Flp pilus assembly protein CpaB n=1 Tax=Novosphingobium cyanobacteriorum TaxID=3024215 RepID=A0ABT6CGS8_9SPHN|nr:Flp pilus assembly protein CpaB [Novosphingobium cyanobacteriorum]MDF8332478.1 Flp pilus assembly protein CpaB [Novosphingobium cyanobacteriorum]
MDKKKLLLLVGALIVAIGTAFAARSLFAGASTPQAEAAAKVPQGPKVLVAQRALPVGTIVTADAISFQPWPKDLVQDAYFAEGEADMSKLLGTVVRNPITAGEPVTQGSLVAPGDRGFLAAALGPGMRAVTIPVSARTGVAGFVFPGDHIDLVLTQTVKAGGGQALKASETILKNLRVLATDQSTEQETIEGKTRVRTFSTVTLEVTPKIAEQVAVAQTIGTISLSLRSIADNSAELEQALASGAVKVPAGMTKAQEEALLKTALSRPIDKGSSFVTGGDVSRFQRKTMPSMSAINGMPEAPPPSYGSAMGRPSGPSIVIRTGPVVNVTRGKETQTVTVGGN